MKISAHFWDEGLKISTVIMINTQSRMCQVCLVLLLFLTLDVPGWSSVHRTRLCVKSFGETAVGESFNNHYFWLSVLQSWSFVDKLYCFSQQKHHSYWSSDAHFLSSFVVSSSVCSGLMCFRSSQWWKTRIHHIAFLLTLVKLLNCVCCLTARLLKRSAAPPHRAQAQGRFNWLLSLTTTRCQLPTDSPFCLTLPSQVSHLSEALWGEMVLSVGRFYIALFSALEQTHCTCMWFYMSE